MVRKINTLSERWLPPPAINRRASQVIAIRGVEQNPNELNGEGLSTVRVEPTTLMQTAPKAHRILALRRLNCFFVISVASGRPLVRFEAVVWLR